MLNPWKRRASACCRRSGSGACRPEQLESRALLCATIQVVMGSDSHSVPTHEADSPPALVAADGDVIAADSGDDFVIAAVPHPSLTSFRVNETGATGSSTDADIDAVVSALSADVQSVWSDAQATYVVATGVPSYDVGPWPDGNPAVATDRDWLFQIPHDPRPNTGTATSTPLGNIGVYVNGVPIYDAQDGMSYNNQGVWRQNAIVFEEDGFDGALGHPSPVLTGGGPLGFRAAESDAVAGDELSTNNHRPPPPPDGGGGGGGFVDGAYHHHQNPLSLRTQLGDDGSGHSPILGWAFDGYPIYGPYGYSATNGTGGVARLASSYQLKPGIRPSGPGGSYDGSYIEDYEYVAGSGALDEHNGRFAVTPEYPDGTYSYVVTIDADGAAAYPYTIGPTFYGVVVTANLTNSVTLPSAAVQYGGDVVVTVPDGTTVTDASSRTNQVRLVKQGLGTLVLDQANTNSGGVLVEAGEVIVKSTTSVGTGPLEIREGGRVTLDVGTEQTPLAGLELLGSGTLDVTTGSVLLLAGSYDLGSVRGLIETARSDGAWSGAGITSGSLAAEAFRGIGYAEQPDGSLVVGYSAVGDATMDGSVNIQDLVKMVASGKYGSEGTVAQWWEGDFNYDGRFDIVDIVAVSASGLYNGGPYGSAATGTPPAASGQTAFLSPAGSFMLAESMAASDEHAAGGDQPVLAAGSSRADRFRVWSAGQLGWLALLDQAGLPPATKRVAAFRSLGGG